jgi:hypothetical protein
MTKNNGVRPSGHPPRTGLREGSALSISRAGLVGGLLGMGGRLEREATHRMFGARAGALRAWEWLEAAFGTRVAQALNALQIPTARDVHELNRRVEALHATLIALERRVATAKLPAAPPRKNGAAAKTAQRAKPSTRKKSGS